MTVATKPSPETRMANLAKANLHRSNKAKVKRELKSGKRKLRRLLADPPPCCLSAPILDALQWAPKVGRSKATRALKRAQVGPYRELGELTAHEKARVLLALEGKA